MNREEREEERKSVTYYVANTCSSYSYRYSKAWRILYIVCQESIRQIVNNPENSETWAWSSASLSFFYTCCTVYVTLYTFLYIQWNTTVKHYSTAQVALSTNNNPALHFFFFFFYTTHSLYCRILSSHSHKSHNAILTVQNYTILA